MSFEKEVNFFEKIVQPVQQVNRKINFMPYKKIVLLALTFALSLTVIQILCSQFAQAWQSAGKEDQIIANSQLKQIKAITPENYANFINYLKYHQTMYDEKFNFMFNYLKASEKENSSSYGAFGIMRSEVDKLNYYKSEYNKSINRTQTLYNKIQNDIKVDDDDIDKFFKDYQRYQLGLLIKDDGLEKELNDYLIPSRTENQDYIKKYKVDESYQQLEKKIATEIKSFNKQTDVVKLNIAN